MGGKEWGEMRTQLWASVASSADSVPSDWYPASASYRPSSQVRRGCLSSAKCFIFFTSHMKYEVTCSLYVREIAGNV